MIGNEIEIFSDHVSSFLSDKEDKDGRRLYLLGKKHTENFKSHGDFSFPNSIKCWLKHLNEEDVSNDTTVLTFIGKTESDLIEESANWNLTINSVNENAGRVCLFLNRPLAISKGLLEGLRNSLLVSERLGIKYSGVSTDESCTKIGCPTSSRVKHLSQVIQNLCAITRSSPEVLVTSKSSNKSLEGNVFLCGSVLNAKTGTKETKITSEEFIRIRQAELSLIAQHKYGVRVTTDSKWKEFLMYLGESAVAFELLQAKPSTAVKINFENGAAGSSKGASFILYNCARLETIIKTHNDKVEDGVYPPLPDIKDVDFTLLNLEDEWCLVFNYILGFPSMLAQSIEVNDKCCDFRPHHICSFLSAMVRHVSQYYRRTRILVEPRIHLLPTIHARIHMLKVLNDTLKTCLKILNIKSVSQM